MDIAEIAGRARDFRARLAAAKAALPQSIAWYPYDSLANFDHLNSILTGARRNLLDLAGDRPVLDVGCADGDVAFFLESLGCKVHAVDHYLPNHNGMAGVRALRRALGSEIEIHEVDVDGPFELPGEGYGLALFLGTLYHLRNPFHVLEKLSIHSRHCILSTRMAQVLPDGAGIRNQPVAYLLDEDELNGDNSNYWIFSECGLRRLLKRARWEILDWGTCGETDRSDPVERDERAFCLLKSRYTLGHCELLEGWHAREGRGWRWTEHRFTAKIPWRHTFDLQVYVPDAIISRFGGISLSASADGVLLGCETYTAAGEYVFHRRIPAAAAENVTIEFLVSDALPPDEHDLRERGIIVSGLAVG